MRRSSAPRARSRGIGSEPAGRFQRLGDGGAVLASGATPAATGRDTAIRAKWTEPPSRGWAKATVVATSCNSTVVVGPTGEDHHLQGHRESVGAAVQVDIDRCDLVAQHQPGGRIDQLGEDPGGTGAGGHGSLVGEGQPRGADHHGGSATEGEWDVDGLHGPARRDRGHQSGQELGVAGHGGGTGPAGGREVEGAAPGAGDRPPGGRRVARCRVLGTVVGPRTGTPARWPLTGRPSRTGSASRVWPGAAGPGPRPA